MEKGGVVGHLLCCLALPAAWQLQQKLQFAWGKVVWHLRRSPFFVCRTLANSLFGRSCPKQRLVSFEISGQGVQHVLCWCKRATHLYKAWLGNRANLGGNRLQSLQLFLRRGLCSLKVFQAQFKFQIHFCFRLKGTAHIYHSNNFCQKLFL